MSPNAKLLTLGRESAGSDTPTLVRRLREATVEPSQSRGEVGNAQGVLVSSATRSVGVKP